MIDFSFIGKEGIIIQYEDIISLTGFNIAKYLKSKNVNDMFSGVSSTEDILLSYINREDENIATWLETFGILNFDINDYKLSLNTFQPNLIYAYKLLNVAYKNGVKNIIIHSDTDSPVIKKFIDTFQLPIKHTHGDIVPIITENITYITSSPKNIRKCLDVKVPFALTIVDDFMYTSDIILNKVDESLRKRNVFVNFTSVISAGFI